MSALTVLQFFHITAVVSWIGGIFLLDIFIVPVLRRNIASEAERSKLLYQIFRPFFAWVWVAGAALVITGYWMVYIYGGFTALPTAMRIMVTLGTLMVMLALLVFFVPFLRMGRAIAAGDWPMAARAAGQIRLVSGINLALAIPTILAGVWGIFG